MSTDASSVSMCDRLYYVYRSHYYKHTYNHPTLQRIYGKELTMTMDGPRWRGTHYGLLDQIRWIRADELGEEVFQSIIEANLCD